MNHGLRWILLFFTLFGILSSYLYVSPHPYLVLAALAIPLGISLLFPMLAVALVLGLASSIDGLVAWGLSDTLFLPGQLWQVWVEPVFWAICMGLLFRLVGTQKAPARWIPGMWYYLLAMSASFCFVLSAHGAEWGSQLPKLLWMTWQAVPIMDQATAEYTLRATLWLCIGPIWLWLIYRSVRHQKQLRVVWFAWLAGAGLTALHGTWMWLHRQGSKWPRIESSLDDVNSYASYLVLSFFLAWAVLVWERSRVGRGFAAIILAASAWMLVLAGSRAALLATLGGVFVLYVWPWSARRFVLAGGSLGGLLLVVSLVGSPPAQPTRRIPSAASQIVQPHILVGRLQHNRLHYWIASMEVFQTYPLFGIGPGRLYQNIGNYGNYKGYIGPDGFGWRENAHNYFLQIAAETGLVGLLGFLWFIWTCLSPGWKHVRQAPRQGPGVLWPDIRAVQILGIGACGYLVTGLTSHPLILSRQVILFWGYIGGLTACHLALGWRPACASRVGKWRSWWTLGVLAGAVVVVARVGGIEPHRCRPQTAIQRPFWWEFPVGFYAVERSTLEHWRWMKEAGQVRFCNASGKTVVADVSVQLQVLGQPRQLAVYQGGKQLLNIRIPLQGRQVTIPEVEFLPGPSSLILVPTPGALALEPFGQNSDPRLLSLRVSSLALSFLDRVGKGGT